MNKKLIGLTFGLVPAAVLGVCGASFIKPALSHASTTPIEHVIILDSTHNTAENLKMGPYRDLTNDAGYNSGKITLDTADKNYISNCGPADGVWYSYTGKKGTKITPLHFFLR